MKAKYIIIEHKALEVPIVFSPILQHSEVAGNKKVISAGFCRADEDGVYSVWGESISLKVKSRPEDAEIINKYLEYDI